MLVKSAYSTRKRECSKGFTLVELVIGITLISVVLVTLVSFVAPLNQRSVDPLWQVRSVTLAQSLFSEMSSKAFDENSITSNGRKACNHNIDCTQASALGSDASESRRTYDDIDDYHNLVLTGAQISNSGEETLTQDVIDLFLGFSAQINVFYDDNQDGINDADTDNDGTIDVAGYIGNQKLIRITVFTPDEQPIVFATYRANF